MARKHISQREAVRLRRRVNELEQQMHSVRYAIQNEGRSLLVYAPNESLRVVLSTANALGHVCVARLNSEGYVQIRAHAIRADLNLL